jgi:hypothetical protein
MGIRWQSLAARFKHRLSLSDLHEATDDVFETSASATGLPEMFQALRESEPGTDHGRLWRNDFSKKLEVIAAEQTRKSQAAECRRLLIKTTEEHALADALVGANQPLVSCMFFEGDAIADMSDGSIQGLVAKQFIFRCVDKVALIMLYTQQFNSTLSLNDFNDDLTIMCKVWADLTWREAAHAILSRGGGDREEGWDRFTLQVVRPAASELEPIMQQFKSNICLLSPHQPDATDFHKFGDRWRKAMAP